MDGIRWNNLQSCTIAQATWCMEVLCKKAKDRLLILFAVVPVLLALETVGAAEEIGQTTPADDMPSEFKVLWGTDSGRDYRWTLVGKNEKASEQEKLHPELNAIDAIWHLPVARQKSVFKFEFTRPVRQGNNVFHLYATILLT